MDIRFIHHAINLRSGGFRVRLIKPSPSFPRGGIRAWSQWHGYLGAMYFDPERGYMATCNFWTKRLASFSR
jgi:hypothetical protein